MAKPFNNQKELEFVSFPKDALHPYTMFNNDALDQALLNLSVTAFKVYIYLGKYKEMKDKFMLSRTHITKTLSISESSYHKAIKELQEKGYIIPSPKEKDNANAFVFLEGPT